MLRIGITGGRGSGTSAVARILAGHGAVEIPAERPTEADPAEPPTEADPAGTAASAGPPDTGAAGDPGRPTDDIQLLDLTDWDPAHEALAATCHLVVGVDCPVPVRVRRLVGLRARSGSEATQWVMAGGSDAERLAASDVVVDAGGSAADLERAVTRLWRERLDPYDDNLLTCRRAKRPQQPPMPLTGWSDVWPARAARTIARIEHALAAVPDHGVRRVDHIGSTAVPGLAAKDVIDLQVTVDALERTDSDDWLDAMAGAGFVWGTDGKDAHDNAKDGTVWPKRFFGSCDPGAFAHVHVREAGSPGQRWALAFRDWLRSDVTVREEYAAMKATVLAEAADTTAYATAKEPWFDSVHDRLEAWVAETGWRGDEE